MPTLFLWRRSVVALCVLVIATMATLAGQEPERAKGGKGRAAIEGRVLDTTGVALADAEVIVTSQRDTSVVGRATSNATGQVTIRDLAPGGPYILLARKIGYGAARGTDIYLRGNDTLRVDFELPAAGVTLPT